MVVQCWLACPSIEDFLPKRPHKCAARPRTGMQGWIIGCAVMAVQFWLSCTHEVQYRTEQLVASWSSSRQSGLLNQSTAQHRSRHAEGRTSMTRRLLGFLRATSWLVLAASFTCSPFSSALAEDIKIGVLEPFTGPWAKNGNESYVAMEIARDMINEQGGIKGKKVTFVRGDAPD